MNYIALKSFLQSTRKEYPLGVPTAYDVLTYDGFGPISSVIRQLGPKMRLTKTRRVGGRVGGRADGQTGGRRGGERS